MRALVVIALLVFCITPYDAQLWALGGLRWLLSEEGRGWLIILAVFGWPAWWYSLGWNNLAAQLHQEDTAKADDALRRRLR